MVVTGTWHKNYAWTGSWLTTATSSCGCTCTCSDYYTVRSDSWVTTSNFEEYRPIGFFYNRKFFKNKKDYLNYKSAFESKVRCKFLSLVDPKKFLSPYENEITLIRKVQFRGVSLKTRSYQKRKMRLHKNK